MNIKILQMMSLSAFVLIGLAGSGNCNAREECLQKCSKRSIKTFNKCVLNANYKHFEKCIPDLRNDLEDCLFTKCHFDFIKSDVNKK